jgi:hypothetical protein
MLKLTLSLSLLILLPQMIVADPYYRDGNGDEDPNYMINVAASDSDGDLVEVKLWMNNDYNQAALILIEEGLSATETGEGRLTINHVNIFTATPGTIYSYQARGMDSTGKIVSITETVTVADRDPAVQHLSGASQVLRFASDSLDDNDLDFAELYVRTKSPADTTFTSSWTKVNLSAYATELARGTIAGTNMVADSGVANFSITVYYTFLESDDYQFRWIAYDAPEGAGALRAEVITGIVPGVSQEVKINAISYPLEGYEAWFESSDLKTETYQIQ